jgi:hypothetical protein
MRTITLAGIAEATVWHEGKTLGVLHSHIIPTDQSLSTGSGRKLNSLCGVGTVLMGWLL